MPSKFRIPKAEIKGVHGAVMKLVAKKMFNGKIPDVAYVQMHHKPILRAASAFGMKLKSWDKLDPNLKSYALMATAAKVGCSWCLDFGYFSAFNEGLDVAKAREIPRWRESDVFAPLEREVLEYTEAMSTTPLTVTDEMVASLVRQLGSPAVVELTQVIAFENMTGRFNSAMGLASQGLSDVCELPLAEPAVAADRS